MKRNKEPEMPYERFLAFGRENLTDAELVAILLRTGCEGTPALEIARKVLTIRGGEPSLHVLHDLTMKDLKTIHGIGEVKAAKLLCCLEISRRLSLLSAQEKLAFGSPSSIADYYMETMRHEKQERVVLVLLDNKLGMMRDETLFVGTVNASLLSPRDVFMRALDHGAVNILLVHNHPSGDPTPSQQDIRATRRIRQLGEMMEIPLIDHIVIGDRCYISMKEAGYI